MLANQMLLNKFHHSTLLQDGRNMMGSERPDNKRNSTVFPVLLCVEFSSWFLSAEGQRKRPFSPWSGCHQEIERQGGRMNKWVLIARLLWNLMRYSHLMRYSIWWDKKRIQEVFQILNKFFYLTLIIHKEDLQLVK